MINPDDSDLGTNQFDFFRLLRPIYTSDRTSNSQNQPLYFDLFRQFKINLIRILYHGLLHFLDCYTFLGMFFLRQNVTVRDGYTATADGIFFSKKCNFDMLILPPVCIHLMPFFS